MITVVFLGWTQSVSAPTGLRGSSKHGGNLCPASSMADRARRGALLSEVSQSLWLLVLPPSHRPPSNTALPFESLQNKTHTRSRAAIASGPGSGGGVRQWGAKPGRLAQSYLCTASPWDGPCPRPGGSQTKEAWQGRAWQGSYRVGGPLAALSGGACWAAVPGSKYRGCAAALTRQARGLGVAGERFFLFFL